MSSLESVSANRFVPPLLLLITLVGALLRIPSLEHESLWHDELLEWSFTNFPDLGSMIEQGVRPSLSSPALSVLLFFVVKHCGDSEFVLRFPSALAGILAIPMMYLLARTLYSYKEGLLAATLTAIAHVPVYYSQEARAYSLLLVFSILTAYLWISIMRTFQRGDRPPYKIVGLYMAAAMICAYLHYFGLYLVLLQGLAAGIVFLRRSETLVTLVKIYLALALLYLPWLPPMLEDLAREKYFAESPSILSFAFFLRFLFNNSTLLLTVAVAFYVSLLVHSLRHRREGILGLDPLSPGLLLTLWLVIPFVGAAVKSLVSVSVMIFRYLIISLPPAYILLSRAITQLPLKVKGTIAVALVLATLFLGDLIWAKQYYSAPHKPQWREAVQYVVERDALYENSLIVGCTPFFNYYFASMDSPRRVDAGACWKEDTAWFMDWLNSQHPRYIWYLWAAEIPPSEFVDFLAQNLRMLEHKTFFKAHVWLFEVAPP